MQKQKFMQNLLADTKFKVINGVGMRTLANGNVVKVSIETNGTFGHYRKLLVKVINPRESTVDMLDFVFDNYLTKAENSRKDHDTFEVVEHCGWVWYILTPTLSSIHNMLDEIEDYIGFFNK
jgi:hypothetical protein